MHFFIINNYILMIKTFKKIVIYNILTLLTVYGQPNTKDYLRVVAELSCFTYSQYGYHLATENSTINAPNKFDSSLREIILWNEINTNFAKISSDILLYGVSLGSIPILPMTTKENYKSLLLIQLEILSINGLITNLFKYSFKRQRPYSYYSTKQNDSESHKSFYSGHASTAFALGISSAKMLTRYTNFDNTLIWTTTMGIASLTGYFRIAADKHYVTDVIVGAIMGSLVGNITFEYLNEKYISNMNDKALSKRINISYNPYNITLILNL